MSACAARGKSGPAAKFGGGLEDIFARSMAAGVKINKE
jgi:hypothetical protein